MSKFSKEEQEILEAFDTGALKRSSMAAETKQRHQAYAEAMFKEDKIVNIRLPLLR